MLSYYRREKGVTKKNAQAGINFFPFIIDLNALTLEPGTKIYFYNCRDMDKKKELRYSFSENNDRLMNLEYKQTITDEVKNNPKLLDKIMMDTELYKNSKLDFVFLQFQEAKSAILQEVEDYLSVEDDEDDFAWF